MNKIRLKRKFKVKHTHHRVKNKILKTKNLINYNLCFQNKEKI